MLVNSLDVLQYFEKPNSTVHTGTFDAPCLLFAGQRHASLLPKKLNQGSSLVCFIKGPQSSNVRNAFCFLALLISLV